MKFIIYYVIVMSVSTYTNKNNQPPKVVVLQNTVLVKQCDQLKRNRKNLLDDEEPVIIDEDDDEFETYVQMFRKSYNLSKTLSEKSKSDNNGIQNIGTQLLSTSGSIHIGKECESVIEHKDAKIQCSEVKSKNAGVQNNFLIEKKDVEIQTCILTQTNDVESQCELQPLEQESNLQWFMNQCAYTPLGKNKDLNQLIRLCKKLIKNPPAELRSNSTENCPARLEKLDPIQNESETNPNTKDSRKKRKTEDTFAEPTTRATQNESAIPNVKFSVLNSSSNFKGRTRARNSSAYQEFRSLTLREGKKRKLYSPSSWESSKRYTDSFVTEPPQRKLFP